MKKNYTLIELLVAMGIFAFMMILLMNFFGISTDLLARENNRSTKLYEASIVNSVIYQDLKNMIVDADGATTFQPFEYSSSGGDVFLRFFSTGYDEDGNQDSIMIVYCLI